MHEDEIQCSRFDPYPFFKPEQWSPQSIAIHHIKLDDVIGQPLIQHGIQAFYRLITVNNRCRCIVVAYNSGFDKSRISTCAEEMDPEHDKYEVTWVDARRLILDEMLCDDDDRVIHKTGKLSEIFQHRMKEFESIDLEKVHGARYDTYMMEQLLLHKYGSVELVRKEIIKVSQQRKGVGCRCLTGCSAY